MEKEQSYRDAAYYYENAWNNTNESNPAIGGLLQNFLDTVDLRVNPLGAYLF